MNEKRLSVNSDDFGLSESINRGIGEAFEKGILTDASLMANGPAFKGAMEQALAFNIPIAAHINLLRGSMLTSMESQETPLRLWKNSLHLSYMGLIEKEVRMQIEKILSGGLVITQLNSEKHTHFFPPLFRLWLRLAEEYGIPFIRFIREFNFKPSIQGIKANLLSLFSLQNGRLLKQSPVRATTAFRGILLTGRLDHQSLIKCLQKLPTGWTELMVHVGYTGPIDATMGRYFLDQSRATELQALINPDIKGIIKALKIVLTDFGGSHGK
jgi:predicted glycoside hydrolase/deacetylase ChbG (UPF0249 family)